MPQCQAKETTTVFHALPALQQRHRLRRVFFLQRCIQSDQSAPRRGRHPVSLGGDPMFWVAGEEEPHWRRLLQPVNRPRAQATTKGKERIRRQVACDPLQLVLPTSDPLLLVPLTSEREQTRRQYQLLGRLGHYGHFPRFYLSATQSMVACFH